LLRIQGIHRFIANVRAELSYEEAVVDERQWPVQLGKVFSEYLSFTCHLSFHQMLHLSYPSSIAPYIGKFMAYVSRDLVSICPKNNNKKCQIYFSGICYNFIV
jgi:hypothetical protein